jgi:hypothetical protein
MNEDASPVTVGQKVAVNPPGSDGYRDAGTVIQVIEFGGIVGYTYDLPGGGRGSGRTRAWVTVQIEGGKTQMVPKEALVSPDEFPGPRPAPKEG